MTDDDLGDFLRDSIPTPELGYWDAIDARLDAAAGDQGDEGHTIVTDIGARQGRPTAMDTNQTTTTNRRGGAFGRPLLAAAAALVLLVGVGLGALALRGSDDADTVGVATQPETEATAEPAPEATATQAVVDDPTPAPTADATIVSDVGALTALQARLDGTASTSTSTYCFAGNHSISPAGEDGPPALASVAALRVDADGTVDIQAVEGEFIAIVANGPGTDDGRFTLVPTSPAGIGGGLPPYDFALTDTSLTIGTEAVLNLVDCSSVQDRIDTMASLLVGASGTTGPRFVDAPEPAADAVLSSAGLGPIRIGMTLSDLNAEVGVQLPIETIDLAAAGECGWVSYSEGIWMLVELTSETDAIVRRVSVSTGPWQTPSGASVGDTEQAIRDLFPGQLDIRPHVYVEGNYLTFIPTDPNDPNTVEFVAEVGENGGDAIVVEIRAGDRGWVSFVEGCA